MPWVPRNTYRRNGASYNRKGGYQKRTYKRTYKRNSTRDRMSDPRSTMLTGPGGIQANGPLTIGAGGGFGFPNQRIVKMRYAAGGLVGITTGQLINQVNFCPSSIFDPDTSGIGHQPIGHDQWQTFYNHYVVLGCKMSMTVSHDLGLAGRAIVCGAYLDDDTVAATNWQPLVESGRAAWSIINPGSSVGSEHNQKAIECYYSAKKFFNVKDVKDNITRLGAPFGSNPTENAFFKCFVACSDNSVPNENTAFTYTIILDYTVLLSEPKDLPLS